MIVCDINLINLRKVQLNNIKQYKKVYLKNRLLIKF